MRITFLGGVGTVTGSKFLLETGSKRLLIDCGLFQGYKQLRLKNWQPFPLEAGSIDAVVLTHAHLDHSGYLPLLVRSGFSGPAYATEATADLLQILLRDSAYLLEREAEYANDKGFSKHDPALPLYTTRDAERALERLRTCSFDTPVSLNDATSLFFQRAGHILGASILTVSANGKRSFSVETWAGQTPLRCPTRKPLNPQTLWFWNQRTETACMEMRIQRMPWPT